MAETGASLLAPWSSFYILIGSAAASLTGLMFVVITLVTGIDRLRRNPDGIGTFSTPTVVHFGTALLLSALLSAPWRSTVLLSVTLGIIGVIGIVYLARLMHRAIRLTSYTPDLEDWAWYTVLPFVAYGTILAAGIMLRIIPVDALFALAVGAGLLIFIGIHNAWDIVTYIVTEYLGDSSKPD
jgi:hypothetical protein